jgi:hypothetical protein
VGGSRPTKDSYDPDGNRTVTDGSFTYTTDDQGDRVKKVNRTTGETWTYGYDDADRLV